VTLDPLVDNTYQRHHWNKYGGLNSQSLSLSFIPLYRYGLYSIDDFEPVTYTTPCRLDAGLAGPSKIATTIFLGPLFSRTIAPSASSAYIKSPEPRRISRPSEACFSSLTLPQLSAPYTSRKFDSRVNLHRRYVGRIRSVLRLACRRGHQCRCCYGRERAQPLLRPRRTRLSQVSRVQFCEWQKYLGSLGRPVPRLA
jgi:hypothetical protein